MASIRQYLRLAGVMAMITSTSFLLTPKAQAHSVNNLIATYSSPRSYNPPAKYYVLGGLFTYSQGSQINVRSGPGTDYVAQHYGLSGDRVFVLNEARGNDGYRWWYLQFKESGAKGWIREDFVAISDAGLREIATYSR